MPNTTGGTNKETGMKSKNEIKVGDIVSIGDTSWKVVERNGFTLGIEPNHPPRADYAKHRTQYVDLSMVKKA
jgi:hypothetical protein